MGRTYPVKAERRSNENDEPKPAEPWETIGIFTAADYWHSSEGRHGSLEFKLEDEEMAKRVAQAINLAYRAGQRNIQERFRQLMGGSFGPVVEDGDE